MPVYLNEAINLKIDTVIADVDRLITWVEVNFQHALAHDANGVAAHDRVQCLLLQEARKYLVEAKRGS